MTCWVTLRDMRPLASGPVMSADEKWDATLDDVRRFREEHGRWPKYREGTLGQWCNTQKQAKKGKRA